MTSATLTEQAQPRSPVDAYLAAVLAGRTPAFPAPDAPVLAAEIVNHGIDGLASAIADRWPIDIGSDLARQALALQFWEDRHKALVSEALAALWQAGVPAMLIKGTACAYSVYDQPWVRTRGDSDLVVDPVYRETAITVLRDLGYMRVLSFADDVAVTQASFKRREAGPGFNHVIDLHWQLSNAAILARLFPVEELLSRAQPLSRLSVHARAPDPADAMLIACFHRYVHRTSPYSIGSTRLYSADRLIWLMDIHLLAQSMKPADWEMFLQRATTTGLARICASGLLAAQARFETPSPDDVLTALQQNTAASPAERYLLSSRRRRFWQELMARPQVRAKAAFLGAHLFPPATYMRGRFADRPAEPLPLLYVRRGWRGLVKHLRPAQAE